VQNLEPRGGMGQRAVSALAGLLFAAWAVHEAYALLRPLIPTLIVLVILGAICGLAFRGRR
jgi:hypothetical protein